MGLTAREVMENRFYTLSPEIPISEAVKVFRQASAEQRQTVFGMMVTDAAGQLAGMLSLYDVLLLLRPKHIHIWGEMADLEITGILDNACRRAKSVLVGVLSLSDVARFRSGTCRACLVSRIKIEDGR